MHARRISLAPDAITISGGDGSVLARLALDFSVGPTAYQVHELVARAGGFTGRTADPQVTVEIDGEGDALRVELRGPFGAADAVVYFRGSRIEAPFGRAFVPDCDNRRFSTRDREEIFLTNSGMILQKQVAKRDLWMIAPPPHILSFGDDGPGWFGFSIPEAMPVVATRVTCDKGAFDLTFQQYSPAHDGGRLPRVHLAAGLGDAKAIIDVHRAHGERLGLIDTAKRTWDWWHNPLYCTWGDQCYLQKTAPQTLSDSIAIPFSEELMQRWADGIRSVYAGEVNYIVDAGWFDHLGDFTPRAASFGSAADFRRALAALKAKGFRVILWFTPFWVQPGSTVEREHPEYLLRRRDGRIYRDPDNRAMLDHSRADVREHTRGRIEFMLGELDADGFKIDMNYVHPLMSDVVLHDGAWSHGNRICLEVTRFIHACATAVKPDAFITISGIEGYLQPFTSSVRLNDLFEVDNARAWYDRAELVTRLMPHVPIDVDGWPSSAAKMREYQFVSPVFGAPVTYYIEGIDIGPARMGMAELNRLASVWHVYAQAPCEHGMVVTVDADADRFERRSPDGSRRAVALQRSALATYGTSTVFITANCDRAVAVPLDDAAAWTEAWRVHRDGRRERVPLHHDGGHAVLRVEDAAGGILCYELRRPAQGA